jgi:hypothetical protein
MDYSWRAKAYHEEAKAQGVPAITTAGIYPGVSNGIASHSCHTTPQFGLLFLYQCFQVIAICSLICFH